MRKFFEKFATLMQAVVSTLFVVFILLLLTGALDKADFNNNVVYILFGTFIAIHVLFTALVLYFQYSMDVLNSVQIYSEGENKTKISISVIRNIIKRSTKCINGVKIRHSSISYDEKGLILNNPIKVANRELSGAIDEVRAAITDTFKEKLSLVFFSINFKIVGYKYQTPTVQTASVPTSGIVPPVVIMPVSEPATAAANFTSAPKAEEVYNDAVADNFENNGDKTLTAATGPEISEDIISQPTAAEEALFTDIKDIDAGTDVLSETAEFLSADADFDLFNENETDEQTQIIDEPKTEEKE